MKVSIKNKRVATLAIAFIISLSVFAACEPDPTHPIPDGKYVPTNNNQEFLLNQESTHHCYWLIKRDIAEYHVSGTQYKYHIVMESDKLYFERVKEKGIKQENIFKYEVMYDESSSIITIYW